ncbi:pentapeptide repeat-containing protein [Jatrophihabitans telluris]|uniref:Pentapeptide repeat-containing protein n=1 Tax=Jatrophihabitans telluris TaxID=2038343 RepID=A0ABY4QYJ5_9ACTN|nr:pentapeptide repeat-containing protein [Jatrophihabitans telluris]UQX88595.1 pentapeptide repeat-containing protein [Jatrophihabitans telluris]
MAIAVPAPDGSAGSPPPQDTAPVGPAARFESDCGQCTGLCCVGLAFSASVDFAFDKPAGVACVNLARDDRCRIHASLTQEGFRGCTVFECLGAGPQISRHTFAGRSWRTSPETAGQMFAAFSLMRQLQELLWYLTQAAAFPDGALAQRPELAAVTARVEALIGAPADALLALDGAAIHREVYEVLLRVSRSVRAGLAADRRYRARADLAGAVLAGADLRGADLRGADLRGALLIGADLTGADLDRADVIGADLRGADVRGARLAGALFVTPMQLGGCTGDDRTTIPPNLRRPGHWC